MPAEISDRTANGRYRVRGRPFPRGVSGNPGGRPRALVDVQELARTHTADAIRALVDALNSPRERVSAAVALLDRGWGKPTTHLAGDAASGPLTAILFEWAPANPEPGRAHPAIDGTVATDIIVPTASG